MKKRADPMRDLITKFPFLPPAEKVAIPPGWLGLLVQACRRVSAVVPPSQWGVSFRVISLAMRDGALDITVTGGNVAVEAVLRKIRRSSTTICSECGTPGVVFHGPQGLRPHCPECLHLPALLRDVEDVLGWRAGIEGAARAGIPFLRVPPTLRASFHQWLEVSRLDCKSVQPWELEEWLRALERAHKVLRRVS